MLDKTFRPEEVESKHYQRWEEAGAFKPTGNPDAEPYTIVIPPPNVTGSLHMGHALNNSLQDIRIRYERMNGKDVLWQPGTDHAGIATQMVVERQLAEEKIHRRDLGRPAFIDKIWEWKAKSGGTIANQLRRLGASCDWSRERFTMDDGLSKAVLKVFVRLHKEGLIYRDKRLVNWDPKFETAISDLEVVQKETAGHMWHFKYPVEGEEGTYLTVATTRPETMLGDTGVAVHPEDERYKNLIGKNCIQPLTGRKCLIVGDDYADPEQGTGAVKMTPAHDFNDFEVGRRHSLEMINIFTTTAHINDEAPEKYRGMERFEARKAVIADMDALGLYAGAEEHTHMVPFGDRGGVPIEPYLTDQWFVDAQTLAKPAIAAVEEGRTKFVPAQWTKTYYEWMYNIQPWCISRQLWWGHQIPAWYGPDGAIFVEMTEEDAQAAADAHYGEAVSLTRDEDVLDTWFSSALWPFSTLGWPDDTPEMVAKHYQTDLLVTGFDIIFFWVARMMMMGLHFMDKEPFHTVYVHALVRDEHGQKMSKSKGNVIDPLTLADEYGADAVRFTLTAMAAQGRDIKLATSRVEGYRNFMTKLWNAARFCEMNECQLVDAFDPASVSQPLNKWVIGSVAATIGSVSDAIVDYRYNEAASGVYQFVWGTFCDWYLEMAKPLLNHDDPIIVAETRATAAWVLKQILHMMHPFTPFVTEELWSHLSNEKEGMLITSNWPKYDANLQDADVAREMDWVISLITGIRSARSEMNVPPSAKMKTVFKDLRDEAQGWLSSNWDMISRLARLESYELSDHTPDGALQVLQEEATIAIPLAGVIDLDAEKARLDKAIKKAEIDAMKIANKLENQGFLAKAPEEVITENRERLSDAEQTIGKLKEALARVEAAM